jgi:hypothetical protein
MAFGEHVQILTLVRMVQNPAPHPSDGRCIVPAAVIMILRDHTSRGRMEGRRGVRTEDREGKGLPVHPEATVNSLLSRRCNDEETLLWFEEGELSEDPMLSVVSGDSEVEVFPLLQRLVVVLYSGAEPLLKRHLHIFRWFGPWVALLILEDASLVGAIVVHEVIVFRGCCGILLRRTYLLIQIFHGVPLGHHLLHLWSVVNHKGYLCVSVVESLVMLSDVVEIAKRVEVNGWDGVVIRVPVV